MSRFSGSLRSTSYRPRDKSLCLTARNIVAEFNPKIRGQTQPQQSPRGRAITYSSSLTSCTCYWILPSSFLTGLVVLPSTTLDGGSFVAVSCITFPLFGLYLFIPMTSAFHHTIHITPFFGVIRHNRQLIKVFVLRAKAPSELLPSSQCYCSPAIHSQLLLHPY
jgi:hypothetical protein